MEFGDTILPEEFWSFVHPEPNTGCWLWGGVLNSGHGYGYFRQQRVHRLTMGDSPDGLPVIDHLCRVRSCCNPLHLEWTTYRENARRGRVGWDSVNAKKTHCPQGHEYSPSNTYEGHQVSNTGRVARQRRCRICTLAQNERSRRKCMKR